jgi:hypothetical protein
VCLEKPRGAGICRTCDMPAREQQLRAIGGFNMSKQFPAKFGFAPQINRHSARMFRCGCDTKPGPGMEKTTRDDGGETISGCHTIVSSGAEEAEMYIYFGRNNSNTVFSSYGSLRPMQL